MLSKSGNLGRSHHQLLSKTKFRDSQLLKMPILNTPKFSTISGCGGTTTVIQTLARKQLDIQLVETPMRRGWSEADSKVERIRFVAHKRRM